MSIYSKSPKNLLRREERFSLRKFKNGLASVTVGATLFFAGASSVSELENSPTVYAAEIDEETAAEGSSQALATPVEESFDFKPETLINSSPWIAEEKLTDSSVVQPGDMGVAATEATAEVVFEDKTVNITATVESTNGNPDGTVQILELNSNQSSYGGTNDHFTGDAEPKDIPTLDVYVPARRLQPGEDIYEKLNFEGEYEMGILTVNFSEEVVNPVLDISGLGGSVQIGYADAGRGAFNATKLEVMNDEVGLRVLDGSLNLKAEQNVVEVASQDTYNRANNPEHLSPAGTGSVLIEGAFTELKFKLYHQVLRYSSASGSEQRFSAQNSTAFDGLNGLDSSYFDHYSLGTYVFYDRYGRRYTETVNLTGRDNADLFRLSFRLQSGKVLVDYVDTEGVQLRAQYEDTPITNVGSPYDTQENTDEYPAEIVANGKTYHLVPAGSYTVGEVAEDGHLTATTTDYGTDDVSGKVAPGTNKITYVYQPGGDVIVHYVINGTDEPLSGEATGIAQDSVGTTERDTEVFTKPGTAYDTTDLKPTEIKTAEGKVYRLVEDATAGDPEQGEIEADKTKEITYKYEEVTGSVTVEYLTEDGEVLIPKADVKRDASLNETYETTYPEEIVTEDGRTFRYTRVDDAFDAPSGDVEEGEKHVVYRYEEVKGDVVVNYVDTNGNVIKLPVVDIPESSTGTGYDTTDNKPTEITTEDGKFYRLVPSLTQGNENGEVVEGTTEITYVYEEVTGSVTVEYLTEDGEVLIPKADVKRDASLNETYETSYPEEIITEDGRTFRYTRVDDAFDAPSGDVEEGEKHVVYLYEEVKGDVVVNYVDTNGNVIKLPVVDTPEYSTGTGYDTTDNKPETITTEDGKTYRLVPSLTQGNENGDVVEGTTEITYVYEEVTGSVTVEYLTEDGEVLIPKADVKRDASLNETYETTYPEEIITEEGRTFRYTRVDDAFDAPTGDVEEGEKHVVYRYEEVKGDVVVNYVDTNGNVIKLPVVDTPESSTGTGYDTTDNKPTEITTEDGKVYRLIPALTQGNENGDVVEGTTEITYVYEEVTGSVTVEYLTEDGEVIIPKADVVRDGSLNETYETTYPEEIVTEDGRTFRYTRVDDAFDAPSGDVEEGEKHVVYRYEEVKGDVVVNYVDTNGNVIKLPVVDTPESSTGTGYDTTDNKPTEITTEDGKVYRLVPSLTQGNENGEVVEGTTEITYVYEEVTGSVTVEYLTEDGEVLIPKADVKRDASLNETYETTYPEEIVTEDGRTFRYTRVDDAFDAPSGDVEEGEKHVVYRYEEVKGDVVVNYVDTNGNVIKLPVVDTPESSTGTGYDTTDNKPETITTEDGKIYRLVPALTQGNENGDVVEGTTEITYVYEEVKGSVTVEYLTEDGEVLIPTADVVRDGSLNETYETTYPEEIVTEDGRTFRYTRVDDSFDAPTGDVEEGEKHVVYRYEEVKGDVVVNYVDKEGNVIKAPVVDTPESSTGTGYDTTDNKPTEITTEDGKVYRLVPSLTQGNENGEVVEGTTEITYVYEEVTGSVTVEYLTEDGEVLIPKADVKRDASLNETYETTYSEEITTEDGRTFRYTRVDDAFDAPSGDVEEGEKHVVYRYEEVKGDVVVNYVDTNGNVIKLPVVDTPESSTGTGYDTTDNKPTEITTEDGKVYRLVPSLTQGNENGEVVEGTTEITYVYEEVVEEPVVEQGNLEVHYHIVDADGNVIVSDAIDALVKESSDAGTAYDTTLDRLPEITVNGKTYVLIADLTDGDGEMGTIVANDNKIINYYYVEIEEEIITPSEPEVSTPEFSDEIPSEVILPSSDPLVIVYKNPKEGASSPSVDILSPEIVKDESTKEVPSPSEVEKISSETVHKIPNEQILSEIELSLPDVTATPPTKTSESEINIPTSEVIASPSVETTPSEIEESISEVIEEIPSKANETEIAPPISEVVDSPSVEISPIEMEQPTSEVVEEVPTTVSEAEGETPVSEEGSSSSVDAIPSLSEIEVSNEEVVSNLTVSKQLFHSSSTSSEFVSDLVLDSLSHSKEINQQAVYVAEEKQALPNTGEESNTASLTGLSILLSAFGAIGLRRRKED